MADVTLTVALQPTANLDNIESQIDALLKGFEGKKRPLRIDFTLSKDAQSSLDKLNSSLTQIQSKAQSTSSALKKINDGINGTGNKNTKTSKTTDLYKQSVDAVSKYYSTMKKYRTLNTDIFTDDKGKYRSQSGKWSTFATELNDVTAAYKKVGSVYGKLSPELRSALKGEVSSQKRKSDLWLEERRNSQEQSALKKAQDRATEIATLDRKAADLKNRIDGYLTKYTAAEKSSSIDSRDAYQNLKKRSEYLGQFREELKTTQKDVKDLSEELKGLDGETKDDDATIKNNGDNRSSWSKNFKNTLARLSTWFSASQVLQLAVRSTRKMVEEAIAVDDAMTQMQIVTKAGSGQMEQFGETAAKVAKKTASSMTDIIDSATTYARLGYDMNTSTNLAEYTSMISKVGDINVADVQSAVTAIVKAFKIDVTDTDQIQSVFDKLIVTGNNLPVSVSELAEGLNNAASSLAAGGNSYEESLAMLAASNATVQDISKSSTGLRTIVARIRNTKTELDSLGESMSDAEYNNIVEALTGKGVSLTDANGNLRDTFDILDDIARVANDLKTKSPNDYAALAETLAGTRMQNIFFSIVENWDEAKKAMDLMDEDSLGALDTAFGTYEESISAHVQKFKTQFQELSTTVIGSDFAKGIVDVGTGLLSFATATSKLAGTLPTLASLVAIIKTIKSVS